MIWLDHLGRPVGQQQQQEQDNSTGSLFDDSNFHQDRQGQVQGQGLIEANVRVWSFLVQRHHNDHILTCQADHPAFEDQQRFANLFGRQPRHKVRLDVQFEPEISLTKDQVQAHENQPLKFHCQARGRPNVLTYRWYLDDKPVANATGPELQIGRASRQLNQREIRCQVSNEVGSDSAVMRLSVNYAPAFVSHLLPLSLQPQIQLAHEWAGDQLGSSLEPIRRHEIVLARQLAVGVEPNKDVELRCDFDGHPRVQSVEWFKLATEYSIMGNVTPAESEDLIQHGALYAPFRYRPVQLDAGADREATAQWPDMGAEFQEVDYEQMSADELALIAADAGQNNQTQVAARLEPLASQPPTPTNAFVFEPLDWTVGQESPMSSSSQDDRHQHFGPGGPQQRLRSQQHGSHQPTIDRLDHQQQQPTIATLSLSSRAFSSYEIESSSVHSSRDRLNWRAAEVMSSRLKLRQVNVDSVGKYVCRAKLHTADAAAAANEGRHQQQQQVARAVYLVLREKPRIISHPLQTAHADQRQISVECLAQINTIVDNSTQIQWFRDGKVSGPRQLIASSLFTQIRPVKLTRTLRSIANNKWPSHFRWTPTAHRGEQFNGREQEH